MSEQFVPSQLCHENGSKIVEIMGMQHKRMEHIVRDIAQKSDELDQVEVVQTSVIMHGQ